MRSLVVVVLDPQAHAFPRRLEAVELGAHQEFLPDRLPEPLDLAERHRVVRSAADVVHPVLLQLHLEAGATPPAHILPAVVGEHLLRGPVLRGRRAVRVEHVLAGLAAEQVEPDQIAGVIVDEPDQVGVLAAEPEGEDVRLPHLVGRSPLKEPRLGRVPGRALGLRPGQQFVLVQRAAHGLRAGRQQEGPAQPLGDAARAERRLLLLELDDLLLHHRRQLRRARLAAATGLRFQPGPPHPAVTADPRVNGVPAQPQFLAHQTQREALLQVQLDGPELHLHRVRRTGARPPGFGAARHPLSPQGVSVHLFLLLRITSLHGNTSFTWKCHPITSSNWSQAVVGRTKPVVSGGL